MTARTTLSTILFIALSAVAGCAGEAPGGGGGGTNPGGGADGGGGSGGGGGSATATQVIEKMGNVECDQFFACKATFPTDAGVTFNDAFGATVTACYSDAAAYYNATAVEAAITAGKIVFDATAAADCVSGLAAPAAPTCSTFWDMGPALPERCYGVFTGKVASGGACVVDFECSGQLICGATSNKCEAAPAGARVKSADGLSLHPKLALTARE